MARKKPVISSQPPLTAKTEQISARYRIQEPRNVDQLVKRMLEDDQFLFGLLIIKSILRGAQVSVACEHKSEVGKRSAEHLETTWYAHVDKFLQSLEYGRQAFEKVFRYTPQGYEVAELNDIPFAQSKMMIDNGTFAGIEVGDVKLTASESAWFSIRSSSTEPHGRSIFLGAPQRVWRLRQDHEKREEVWYKRFSIGRGIGRAPAEYSVGNAQGSYSQVDESGRQSSPMVDLKLSLESIEAGGDLVLPASRDQNGNLLFDYLPGNDLKDGAALESRRRMLDIMALRSLGIPERAITQDGATGSRAVADAHGQVMYDVIESYLADLVECYQVHIVDPIERYNALPPGSLKVNYRSLSDRSEQRVEEVIRTAIMGSAVSPLISSGLVDIVGMLRMVGYPLGPNPEEALKRLTAPTAAPAAPSSSFAFQLAHRFAESCVERRAASAS